jgi:nucleotide-binding universal stress UspA family protein
VQAVNAWRWEFPELRAEGTTGRMVAAAQTLIAEEIRALPPHETQGVPLALEPVEGIPADVLVEAAHDADLLVLGSHGHSRQLHQVLGSVSEACIRHATCPVLIIPAAAA